MPLTSLILTQITNKTFGYLMDAGKGKLDKALFGDLKKKAFERALEKSIHQLEAEHREWVESLFDASFLEREGAPVLAQFLLRDGKPDSSELARRWAESLRLKDERQTKYVRELEPVIADFFQHLSHALKAEPELSELYDSAALERIAESAEAIRAILKTEKATPGTRYDYLSWLIDRNLYLDPRGIEQTQRQVQLKLNEIYVSLRAQRDETRGPLDKRSLEKELSELEMKLAGAGLAAEEFEDRQEQLKIDFQRRRYGVMSGGAAEVLELYDVVSRYERLVILGDPGSGKTTLLRYLALMHAQASYNGSREASSNLGTTRFPIFIRIAAYAENGVWKQKSLSDFLAEYCTMHECTKSGLADLLTTQLEQGNCLILLDGLDEIVSADDRRGIVQKIEEFIRRHDRVSNRFIITSRIAGYNSAPLAEPSVHYTIQDMDEAQIERFLSRWCPAVEVSQTPDVSPETRAAVAHREIDSILKAVRTSPGVRRLAANPLLLTVLALIHRTGARLPEKRIQLYKLAAETLARTWRTAQGVPESALVDEAYLTRLLSKLAYWMHVNKPTGIATEQEVYRVLGKEWARIKRLDWDEHEPDPAIVSEVKKFLETVRIQTGLFVERAPKRYGFMHLTFEEYYAARHLITHSKKAAGLIRQHLHNPRWEEPILLALGFKGLDFPEETGELLETAILAEGKEAEELGFQPSEYEDLLGRDYLFALRCLADQIPVDPQLIKKLTGRLADELLHNTGLARFRRYRQMLQKRLESLRGSDAAPLLIRRFNPELHNPDTQVRLRIPLYLSGLGLVTAESIATLLELLKGEDEDAPYAAVSSLGQLGQSSPEAIAALIKLLDDENATVRYTAAGSLGRLGQSSPEVIAALLTLLDDENATGRYTAAGSLGQLGQSSPEVIAALIKLLDDENATVRYFAASSLGQLGQSSPEVIAALLTLLNDENATGRYFAASSLGQLGQSSPEVIAALIELFDDEDDTVRYIAARSLRQLEQSSPEAIAALIELLDDKNATVRHTAARSLGQLGQSLPEAIAALIELFDDEDDTVRRMAARSLGEIGQSSPEAIAALIKLLDDENAAVRHTAVSSLGQLGQSSPEVITTLMELLKDEDATVRRMAAQSLIQVGETRSEVVLLLLNGLQELESWPERQSCAVSLGQIGYADGQIISGLLKGLLDRDNDVRKACAEALANLGRHVPDAASVITEHLINAIKDPAFEAPDEIVERPAYDYAYDGLWLLVVGEAEENKEN